MSSQSAVSRHRQKNPKNKTSRSLPLIAMGFVVVIAGWVGWNAWQEARTPSIETFDTIGTQPGEIAPDFTVPTLDGGTYTLSAQHGKPTMIFFMAYWCGTCIPEARALAQLKTEFGDRLSIIAIDLDPTSTPQALQQFKEAGGDGAFTWAFDAGQEVANSYQVRSLDTTYVLDAQGHIVYKDEYPTTYQTLRDALAQVGL